MPGSKTTTFGTAVGVAGVDTFAVGVAAVVVAGGNDADADVVHTIATAASSVGHTEAGGVVVVGRCVVLVMGSREATIVPARSGPGARRWWP